MHICQASSHFTLGVPPPKIFNMCITISCKIRSCTSQRGDGCCPGAVLKPLPIRLVQHLSGLRLRLTVLLPIAAAGVPEPHVTLSHEVGCIGLLEREAAAILNAALRPLASRVIPALQQALKDSGMKAPLRLTSNDGTLISADTAQKVGHHARLPLLSLL